MSASRICPNCGSRSIDLRQLFFASVECSSCHARIASSRIPTVISNLLIALVTICTTAIVYITLGPIWALMWFSVPIGTLNFIKVRILPLAIETEAESPASKQ